MKKLLLPLIFTLACTTSCKNTWSDEDKETFYQSCMEETKTWEHNESKAKLYCQCVTDKIIQKYPHENDALEHIDSVIADTALFRPCKEALNGN